jgi:hypothetical protein
MSRHTDQALLDAVRLHRQRLRSAFLHGALGARRQVVPVVHRVLVSLVVGAVALAITIGVSYARNLTAGSASLFGGA